MVRPMLATFALIGLTHLKKIKYRDTCTSYEKYYYTNGYFLNTILNHLLILSRQIASTLILLL